MRIRDVQLLREAVRDLEAGRAFYERQQAGIGEYFWDGLIADMESLLIHAGVHQQEQGYYRLLAKRFPYAVYYDIEDEVARIVAVLPLRRDPAWLKRLLGGRPGNP